jgi:tRNA-splicing ligase RtcB (3'-phosphate/5'-hydroxy nucleic acid ligase)
MQQTFGSTAHGAGRRLSRQAAMRQTRGRDIYQEMSQQGIHVMARGRSTLAEEAPEAYKDVDAVVDVIAKAGLSKPIARMVPLGVVKG